MPGRCCSPPQGCRLIQETRVFDASGGVGAARDVAVRTCQALFVGPVMEWALSAQFRFALHVLTTLTEYVTGAWAKVWSLLMYIKASLFSLIEAVVLYANLFARGVLTNTSLTRAWGFRRPHEAVPGGGPAGSSFLLMVNEWRDYATPTYYR